MVYEPNARYTFRCLVHNRTDTTFHSCTGHHLAADCFLCFSRHQNPINLSLSYVFAPDANKYTYTRVHTYTRANTHIHAHTHALTHYIICNSIGFIAYITFSSFRYSFYLFFLQNVKPFDSFAQYRRSKFVQSQSVAAEGRRVDACARTHNCCCWERVHCLEMKNNLVITMRVWVYFCLVVGHTHAYMYV